MNLLGISERLDLLVVPSVLLSPGNNRKPLLLRYKGDPTLELMTLFLKQAGSDPKLKSVQH